MCFFFQPSARAELYVHFRPTQSSRRFFANTREAYVHLARPYAKIVKCWAARNAIMFTVSHGSGRVSNETSFISL
jgi:hypothetical protein